MEVEVEILSFAAQLSTLFDGGGQRRRFLVWLSTDEQSFY
jgi:hypothetical protein